MYTGNSLGDGCNIRSGEIDGIGQIAPFIGPAASLISPLISLISGKQHFSPYGFLVDDYPDNIVANEVKINQLQTQIANLMHQPPPAPYAPAQGFQGHNGSPAWQATMLPLIQKYAPGYTQYVATYARQLGDGYNQTFAAQLQLIQQLSAQLQQAQGYGAVQASIPIPGSATAIPAASYPLPIGAPGQYYPPVVPNPAMYSPPPSYFPGSPSPAIDLAPQPPPPQQIVGADMTNYLLMGFGAFALILLVLAQRKPAKG
jgi:hypothetical protein